MVRCEIIYSRQKYRGRIILVIGTRNRKLLHAGTEGSKCTARHSWKKIWFWPKYILLKSFSGAWVQAEQWKANSFQRKFGNHYFTMISITVLKPRRQVGVILRYIWFVLLTPGSHRSYRENIGWYISLQCTIFQYCWNNTFKCCFAHSVVK